MNRAKKYGLWGAALGAVSCGAINLIRQGKRMAQHPGTPFNREEWLLETSLGTVLFAAAGAGIGAIADDRNERIPRVNASRILFDMAKRAMLSTSDPRYLQMREKVEGLIGKLRERFGALLKTPPMMGGSTAKGTALRENFDFDVFLSFTPDSFPSTEVMYMKLSDYLRGLIGRHGVADVREQKKSIGVTLVVGFREYQVDIVPCKISDSASGCTSGYLYVNPRSLFGSRGSYTKTDFQRLTRQKLGPVQRHLLILLKCWRNKYNLPMSSYLLENLLLDAYAYNAMPSAFAGKLLMVFRHIANNLDVAVIRSIENTNNILTNIPASSKAKIIDACNAVINDYEYQPNSILDAFK